MAWCIGMWEASIVSSTRTIRVTATEIVQLACEHLAAGRGLSVIRLGDGESRLMGMRQKQGFCLAVCAQTARLARWQLKNIWFGKDFRDSDIDRIATDLRWAIRQADVIGLPRADQIAKNADYANVEIIMDRLDLVREHHAYANCSLHREMQEQGLFDELLAGLDHIYTITCHDIGKQIAERFQIGVVQIDVPQEVRTSHTPHDHYPNRYQEVRKLLSHSLKGELVLVGAGVLGKVYCSLVKQSGGVGLDIGSIFDGWAGVLCRSYLAQQPEVYAL